MDWGWGGGANYRNVFALRISKERNLHSWALIRVRPPIDAVRMVTILPLSLSYSFLLFFGADEPKCPGKKAHFGFITTMCTWEYYSVHILTVV